MSEEKKMDLYLFTLLRVATGFIFLWAFLDKTFGLGRTYSFQGVPTKVGTLKKDAWINGGDPTWGFLTLGTKGKYFGDFYSGLAGNTFVTWLFMLGLLGIGTALILGIFRRISASLGILMMLILWTASIPISTNPIIDDHIVYAIILAIIGYTDNSGIIFLPKATEYIKANPFLV